jgi:hypothetical protein
LRNNHSGFADDRMMYRLVLNYRQFIGITELRN